ncbi:hypothetical protein O6P43_005868 [Quillaja saponaria]|uniref:Uncharacterized protein n=1 Tax=Quillaja saponaria TaxID=32244 RepID=A0AAD7Q734_QUISA|nr:hypothetical protein O6P43_005868 [Quillaja saponaria]
MMTNLGREEGLKLEKGGSEGDDDNGKEEDDSEDDYDEVEEDVTKGGSSCRAGHGHEDEDGYDEGPLRKRPWKAASSMFAQLMQQLNSEGYECIPRWGEKPVREKAMDEGQANTVGGATIELSISII